MTSLLHSHCLATKLATMPSWGLHALPRLLASGRTISFQSWFQPPSPHRVYHCSPRQWRHLRLSTPNLAIFGFRGAQVSSLPMNASNDLRRNVRTKALPTTYEYVRARKFEVIPDTPLPPVPRNAGQEIPSTTHTDQGRHRSRWPTSPCKMKRICQTSPNVQDCRSIPSEEVLQLGYMFFMLALYMVVAVLLWMYGPFLKLSCGFSYEWIKGFSQRCETYKQEKASIEDTKEQGLDRRGGVWGMTFSIFQIIAYYWDNDPDWYPGSILSKIVSSFRDVSIYAVAILLAAYMIF